MWLWLLQWIISSLIVVNEGELLPPPEFQKQTFNYRVILDNIFCFFLIVWGSHRCFLNDPSGGFEDLILHGEWTSWKAVFSAAVFNIRNIWCGSSCFIAITTSSWQSFQNCGISVFSHKRQSEYPWRVWEILSKLSK